MGTRIAPAAGCVTQQAGIAVSCLFVLIFHRSRVCVCAQVERGGKADVSEEPLLVGDEIIAINEVELTGFRQEAIALVKGSYKTLQVTVRRYGTVFF